METQAKESWIVYMNIRQSRFIIKNSTRNKEGHRMINMHQKHIWQHHICSYLTAELQSTWHKNWPKIDKMIEYTSCRYCGFKPPWHSLITFSVSFVGIQFGFSLSIWANMNKLSLHRKQFSSSRFLNILIAHCYIKKYFRIFKIPFIWYLLLVISYIWYLFLHLSIGWL